MSAVRRFRLTSLCALASILIVQTLVSGCARKDEAGAAGGETTRVVGTGEQPPAASGIEIKKAGINPPRGDTFTCWISGSGFQPGDKVLVNGTVEIATTFGNPGLVTFVAGVELFGERTALTLVVLRPGTELRSNSIDAPVPAGPPPD